MCIAIANTNDAKFNFWQCFGLCCCELLALRPIHSDSKKNIVLLKNFKGKTDRITPLSSKILEMLREYYILFKRKTYLFEGANSGESYSEKKVYKVY
ncbi:hypothetical protein ACHRVZ_15780 [Flavobacterium sp. FlaQc-57]|uniref:hypothetical protein n=1 Tax=Flavobacterium sp. FlaQc-57 TaxID=3374186 RepID=UPI003757704D